MKKVIGGRVLVAVAGGLFYVCGGKPAAEDPALTAETAVNPEECAEVKGSWVDTTNSEGCIAASGEWKDDACSIGSYCEAVAEEPKDVEVPAENTEPTEGQ